MPVTFFYLSPAKPGGPPIAARIQNRPGRFCMLFASLFTKEGIPHSGEKGGIVSRQSEAPAERMAADRQIPIICAELVEGANRGSKNIRKSGYFWNPPRRGGVLNSEGKKVKTKPITFPGAKKLASAASAGLDVSAASMLIGSWKSMIIGGMP